MFRSIFHYNFWLSTLVNLFPFLIFVWSIIQKVTEVLTLYFMIKCNFLYLMFDSRSSNVFNVFMFSDISTVPWKSVGFINLDLWIFLKFTAQQLFSFWFINHEFLYYFVFFNSGFNDMKSALSDYLKKFAENGKVVRAEDIREFFSQMEQRKRQKTDHTPAHFCR